MNKGALRRYAAIDIGTVTCRLLIADVDKDAALHEVKRGYAITNLGEGVDATGLLALEAMQRVCDQVEQFQKTIKQYQNAEQGITQTIVVATSAARDAKNSSDFIARLAAIGISLTIISGEREAALSFRGASSDFLKENILVADIGGGSTEIIVGHAGESPVWSHSFNVGCRRLTERFFVNDPPQEQELQKARQWVVENMEEYFAPLKRNDVPLDRMLAVAGTATSAIAIHKRMAVYDSAQVHGSILSRNELKELYDDLKKKPLEERKKTVGLDPQRAGVIVAGFLILGVVMELCGQKCFTASESDILQGIILDASTK